MDSEDDVFHYDSEDDHHNLMEAEAEKHEEQQSYYKILKEEDIKHLQQNLISTVSSTLSTSAPTACTFLCRHNWNLDSVYDNWFLENNITDAKPTTEKRKQNKHTTVLCKICFDTIPIENALSTASCRHLFCTDCWKTYLSVSIHEGLRCLTMRCPDPKCKSYIGFDMVDSLSSPDDRDKYYRYLSRAYVESNPKRKWCPSPQGCDFVIESDNIENFKVSCDCGYQFCWKCSQEWHSPLDCETVAKWIEKNNSEAENASWILVNTKPCPKCRKSIEKNRGCNHMSCPAPCEYQFCWICLGPWVNHGEHACNKYKEERDSADSKNRNKIKLLLRRYAHYYERWASNNKSMIMSLVDLRVARDEHVGLLADLYKETPGQLAFVVEAWEQVVECRRVLKWSYAYGFYMSEGKKDLFEHLQGRAEWALETLHHCAEKEMSEFLSPEQHSEDFKEFRTKLVGLTAVTKNYFENLVGALESNLCEFAEVKREKRKRSTNKKTSISRRRRRNF